MGGIEWKSAVESSLLVLIIPCKVRRPKNVTVTEVFIAEIWAFRYTLVLLVSEFGLLDNGSVSHFSKKKKKKKKGL